MSLIEVRTSKQVKNEVRTSRMAKKLCDDVNMDALNGMVSSVVEGGLVLQGALREYDSASEQIMLLRSYLKLLFLTKA
ncbi:MAG: hypothetical protein ACE37E_14420 [Hyphomicrobiales bacterium]